jgi:hypothetical protein
MGLWESQAKKRVGCGPHKLDMKRRIEETVGKLHQLSSFLFFGILKKL